MKYIHIIIFMLFYSFAFGQQNQGGLSYLSNTGQYNPGAVGVRADKDYKSKTFLSNQTQWLKMRQSPMNLNLYTDVKFRNIGLGGSLDATKYHIFSKYHFKTSYSYQIIFKKDSSSTTNALSFGTSLGFMYQKIDLSKANPSDPTDNLLSSYQGIKSSFTSDVGLEYYILPSDNTLFKCDVSFINIPLGQPRYQSQQSENSVTLTSYPTLILSSQVTFLKEKICSPGFLTRFDWQTISKYPVSKTDFVGYLTIDPSFKKGKKEPEDHPFKLKLAVGTSVNFGINRSLNKGFVIPISTALSVELYEKVMVGFAYRNTSTANQFRTGDSFDIQLGYFIGRK